MSISCTFQRCPIIDGGFTVVTVISKFVDESAHIKYIIDTYMEGHLNMDCEYKRGVMHTICISKKWQIVFNVRQVL